MMISIGSSVKGEGRGQTIVSDEEAVRMDGMNFLYRNASDVHNVSRIRLTK